MYIHCQTEIKSLSQINYSAYYFNVILSKSVVRGDSMISDDLRPADPCWSSTLWFQWGWSFIVKSRVKSLATPCVTELDR